MSAPISRDAFAVGICECKAPPGPYPIHFPVANHGLRARVLTAMLVLNVALWGSAIAAIRGVVA